MPFPKKTRKARVKGNTSSEVYEGLVKKYPSSLEVDRFVTGFPVFDWLIGGGIPRGVFIDFAGPTGLGKTTSWSHVAACFCEAGHTVVTVDTEFALREPMLEAVGLLKFKDKLWFPHQLNTFIAFEEVFDSYVYESKNPPALFICDSVTGLYPSKRNKAGANCEDDEFGIQARILGRLMPRIKGISCSQKTTVVWINQMRVDTTPKTGFNAFKKELKPWGGQAYQFYNDIRVECSLQQYLYPGGSRNERPIGCDLWAEVTKNKTGPSRRAMQSVMYGEGIADGRAIARMYWDHVMPVRAEPTAVVTLPSEIAKGKKCKGLEELEDWVNEDNHSYELFGYLVEKEIVL